ncbi:hypothetical protein GGI25_003352 [Coemansia spiralis]|uniref:PSP1 C-terminal domain-containing protein n=2 Tax=Coemansia TaxID=4863 RepID=A0A9W8KWK5_9FUNG|nr:hypothetical protein EDC05_003739 [Coemansia umbellata]KAJ2621670.1 hypothetical protein GGI26_003878 [Coemansia sp. RSA 1358]KAJ2676817.1 hypothetical protein GGI25_003352 [Coemansia spiralis]
MYGSSKASRDACASSSSPASSPLTPNIDPLPAEPLFTEYSSQSATLDSIGAWSAVQPGPPAQALSAMATYKPAADIRELGKKYNAMSLSHKPSTAAYSSAEEGGVNATNGSIDNSGGTGASNADDVDYSELDEAILRGRSTTLPNIFTVPNPIYRFSTVASIDSSGSPGPISPVSNSGFGMLSRHGSISVSNSNRTVSPLGLSLNANPIHQTASLDNPLTSSLDPIHTSSNTTASRYEMAIGSTSGILGKANPSISGSVSSTSTLAGAGGGTSTAIPIRRFSEFSTDPHHAAMNLASYSMSSMLGSGGCSSNNPPPPLPTTSSASDNSVNGSGGVSHGGSGRAALAPLSIPSIANNASSQSVAAAPSSSITGAAGTSTGTFSMTNDQRAGDNSAYPPGMHARYAQLGHHLPTMREEDFTGALESQSPPALVENVLMRNMSMPSFGNSALATPLPQPLDPPSSSFFSLNRISTASPININRRTSAEPVSSFAALDSATERDALSSNAYVPQRVKSLKDMRRPSLDIRSENATSDIPGYDGQAANALFERSSGLQQSMALSYLSGMANLHRRHSLASANPQAFASQYANYSANSDDSGNAAQLMSGSANTGDYAMYSQFGYQGAPQQSAVFPTPVNPYAMHQIQLQRQQSMSVQPTMQARQDQQLQQQYQISAYSQYPAATPAPNSRGSTGGVTNSSNSTSQHNSIAAPRSGFYGGPFFGQTFVSALSQHQQSQQQQALPLASLAPTHMQPHLPPLLQPIPVPMPIQQPRIQQQTQQRPSRSTSQQHQQQQQQQSQSKQSQQSQQAQQQQAQHHHMRRASHPAIVGIGHPNAPIPLFPSVPVLNGGSHPGPHTLLPNPATTINPNMPFADMGKGLAYQSLPKDTRIFVVQFKGTRCDLYFAPSKGMDIKIVPTLAPSAAPIPTPAACGDSTPPTESRYEPGTYVLVEADRGVDLGAIKEELHTSDAIRAFSNMLLENSANGGGSSGFVDPISSDGRSSVAPIEGDGSFAVGNDGGSSNGSKYVDVDASGGASAVDRNGESMFASAPSTSNASAKDVLIKRIFRVADQREVADLASNKMLDEQNALMMCQSKVQQRKLSMCVVDAEFQFDRRKLTFYFTADQRVDFRELVRELFKHFKTRIWMCRLTN